MTSFSDNPEEMLFFQGGGEMGALMRTTDWNKTPLGSPVTWPVQLKHLTSTMLGMPSPMLICWGEDYTQLYNDAFRPILGQNKHPRALGIGVSETYAEIWETLEPLFTGVMQGNPVTFQDFKLTMNRNGYPEDTYFDFSYSPIRDEYGHIHGVLVICTETSDKMNAIATLSESEERFRSMAEATDIMIAMSNETSNAIYFNKAWIALTGRRMKELLEFGWVDLVHPEDREKYVNIYLDAFRVRGPFSGEFRVLNKEDEYRRLLASGSPRFSPEGQFLGYISACTDITVSYEQQQNLQRLNEELAAINEELTSTVEELAATNEELAATNEELAETQQSMQLLYNNLEQNEARLRVLVTKSEESEQEIRALVESAPFPIGVYKGREMRVAFANQSIMDIWGKGNDVIGKLFSDVLPELDNQEVFKQLDQVFTTGVPFHIKNQRLDLIVNEINRPYYFNYSLTPLFDSSGGVYGVMNTGDDVTELNLAKQELEQSEKNFRSMVLQAPVAMCILIGPDHVVEVANDLMIQLWGKDSDSVMGKPIFEALPDARNQGLEEVMANVYTTGETFKASEMPVELVRKGKHESVFQNFVYEPYKDVDGNILGVLAISIDVTSQVVARRQIEDIVSDRTKELAEVNKTLQKSNAELAQFAYIASHDLQEPLRKISIFSQMLGNRIQDKLDEKSNDYLHKISNSSERMAKLIKDVLNYSQLQKDYQVFELVDLNKVIDNITSDYDLLIEEKGAMITCDPLPSIEAIPIQMSQLFNNLIGNALKFARRDIKLIISITAKALPASETNAHALSPQLEYYHIRIEDNGIGLKEEYIEQIFNIFQRLHRKSEYEGTGIGLAMCKKITLNHHGDINASGSSESGAVINVILPLRQ